MTDTDVTFPSCYNIVGHACTRTCVSARSILFMMFMFSPPESGGDVCGTEVVHEGGVGPEVVDGRAVGEHTLPALACMCELLAHKGQA